MEFKDRIKELRNKRNMSQAQLAAFAGKGEGAVRAWESGKAKPDVDTLIKLVEYFGVSSDYLLGLSPYKSRGHLKLKQSMITTVIDNFENILSEDREIVIKAFSRLVDDYNMYNGNEEIRNTYLEFVSNLTESLDFLARLYRYTPQLIDNTLDDYKSATAQSDYLRLLKIKDNSNQLIDGWFKTNEEGLKKHYINKYGDDFTSNKNYGNY